MLNEERTRLSGLTSLSVQQDHVRKIRILAVDDNPDHLELLGYNFSCERYLLTAVEDAPAAARSLLSGRYDIVLLDLNLRGVSGLDLCRQIRKESALPIIMLTAHNDQASRVAGLELGADDYVVKPYDPRELEARVRAVLRRYGGEASDSEQQSGRYQFGAWVLDDQGRCLLDDSECRIDLTGAEYRLLKAFVHNANRVLSRDQLMNMVRGQDAGPFDRSIDTRVARLRRKLKDDGRNPTLIKSFRGEGYCLATSVCRV